MIFVLMGAPGAGKGTQADLLVEDVGFHKISTGDALRRQISEQSEIGMKASAFMKEGKLVPDDILLGVLKREVEDFKEKKILLDGYPRNLQQAETLERLGYGINGVIHIDVDRTELLGRLSGRRICGVCNISYHLHSKAPKKSGICDRCEGELLTRDDDTLSKVEVRLKVYENETAPVLEHYRNSDLYYRVDGGRDVDSVAKDVKQIIFNLSEPRQDRCHKR